MSSEIILITSLTGTVLHAQTTPITLTGTVLRKIEERID